MGKITMRVATAAAIMAAGGLAGGGTAQAGEGNTVDVSVEVWAPNAPDVMDDLTVEIWTDAGDVVVGTCDPETGFGDELSSFASAPGCTVPSLGTYQIGLDGAPAGATVTAFCSTTQFSERIPGSNTTFTIDQSTAFTSCNIQVIQPAVLIDKIVADGDAAPGDFVLEVFGDTGEPITVTDTSTALCGPFQPLANCAVVPLPPGDYQLGEIPVAGYLPANVWCDGFLPIRPGEIFPAGVGEFSLGVSEEDDAFPFVQCQVTNKQYDGSLVVEKVVVNDDDGTATAADFTAEVYLDGEALEIDGQCDADGNCVAVTLPVGEYRIGETGPGGYTPSVVCTVTREPDYGISTNPPDTTLPSQDREAIAGDAALALVEPFGEVTCVITNDDIPTTTTTTTTTIAPTTTDVGGQPVVPTTLTPTLPATGPSETNTMLIVLALGLLTIGGSLLALRRR
jgi:LPXTG-motif cell wall-anchored protein